jgi:hypothetical protein
MSPHMTQKATERNRAQKADLTHKKLNCTLQLLLSHWAVMLPAVHIPQSSTLSTRLWQLGSLSQRMALWEALEGSDFQP